MQKIIAALMALILMIGCTALAENADELMALEFEHFIIAIRKDAVGTATDTIESNVPFLVVYQNYDPNAAFCSSMNIVWNKDVLDLDAADPADYAAEALNYTLIQHGLMGLDASNAKVLNADYDEHDGHRALSFIVCMDLDYSALGLDYQTTLYTLQAVVPIEGVGTYTFTIGTDDLEGSQVLMDIVDSVRWKV